MKVYFDAYNVVCCGQDADAGIGDTPTVIPITVLTLDDSEGFPIIEVSEAEYQEFLACKDRLKELQDIFADRVPIKE